MSVGIAGATGRLECRPALAGDEKFLRALFMESRPELHALPAPLVDLQMRAQRRQYSADAPDSVERVVELDQVPVGRCWVARSAPAHRVLDLSIAGTYRNRGLGTRLLRGFQAEAAGDGVPLHLAVWGGNTGARRLYARLGFTQIAATAGYLELQWTPEGRR